MKLLTTLWFSQPTSHTGETSNIDILPAPKFRLNSSVFPTTWKHFCSLALHQGPSLSQLGNGLRQLLSKQCTCPRTTEKIREQILRFSHTSYSSLFPRGIIKHHNRAALLWQPWELTFLWAKPDGTRTAPPWSRQRGRGRISHRLLNWQGYTLEETVISMKGDLYASLYSCTIANLK